MVVVLYGVSGVGKSLVGGLLASQLGWIFYDADDLHSPPNIHKLTLGIPLTDTDREPWLRAVRALVSEWIGSGTDAVVACSALKRRYREYLRVDDDVKLVQLEGSIELVADRLRRRSGHFMNPNLLDSQFQELEPPGSETALVVSVAAGPREVVEKIRIGLGI